MTFVIIAGEIDLSVASVMGFAGVHRGRPPRAQRPAVRADPRHRARSCRRWSVSLQGLVITKLELPSLVVTLAGLIAWRGAARILVEDRSVGDYPRLVQLARPGRPARPAAVRDPAVRRDVRDRERCILHRSDVGRYVYVIGDNADVARYSGIKVDRVRASHCSCRRRSSPGLAGILFAARLGTARGDLANGFELEIITIVLLGGVSIFGGSGRMSRRARWPILIVLNIRNGFGLAGVDGTTQTGVIGVILIASVLVQNVLDPHPATAATQTDRQRRRRNRAIAAA